MNNEPLNAGTGAAPSQDAAGQAPHTTVPASSGRKLGPLVAVIAVLAIAGAGAAAYFRMNVNPDLRVGKALKAASAVESMAYDAHIAVDALYKGESVAGVLPFLGGASGTSELPVKLTLDIQGAQDGIDSESIKGRTTLALAIAGVMDGQPLGTLEIRNVDGMAYVGVTSVPEIPSFDLSPIKGQWIKASGAASSKPKTSMTPEQRAEIERAFVEIRPARVAETLPSEMAGGELSDRYRLAVDREKLEAFGKRVEEIMGTEAKADGSEAISALPEDVDVRALEIWIGKKSNLPTRMLLKMHLRDKAGTEFEGDVAIDATFSDFGKPVAVEAPKDAKEIGEVIGMLLGMAPEGMMPEAQPMEFRTQDATLETLP